MYGEYPLDYDLVADTHVGKDYILHQGVEVTVCGEMGDDGEIVDYNPDDWYQLMLARDDVITTLELSIAFDPLVHVHGANVIAWIPAGASVLSSIDNF